jgi:hypothetical protein
MCSAPFARLIPAPQAVPVRERHFNEVVRWLPELGLEARPVDVAYRAHLGRAVKISMTFNKQWMRPVRRRAT